MNTKAPSPPTRILDTSLLIQQGILSNISPCPKRRLTSGPVEFRKPLSRRLQPIPLVVRCAFSFNNMEGIYNPPLLTRVPLALVQEIAMYEDKRPSLDLAHHVLPILTLALPPLILPVLLASREPRARVVYKLSPGLPVSAAHEALPHRRPPVAAGQEAEAPVLGRGVLQRVPEPHALGVEVYRNVLSWCGGTAPPISRCLQITMDCSTRGSRKPRARATAAGCDSRWPTATLPTLVAAPWRSGLNAGSRSEAKGGDRTCK